MTDQNLEYPEIEQDHKKGPGWFLMLTYVVVLAFMVYYFFTYKDWKSNYDEQQAEIHQKLNK
ncbi:MAG: hypothetical protein ABFR36_02995 [Acidobacteriota bacterium]